MPIEMLSEVSGAGAQAMAPDPATRSVEHQLLPRRLHPAPRTEPSGTDFTQATARPAVRCQFPDPARSGRRSPTPRRRDRIPIHPAHMGIQPAAPLSYPRSRSRRRTVRRSSSAGFRPAIRCFWCRFASCAPSSATSSSPAFPISIARACSTSEVPPLVSVILR